MYVKMEGNYMHTCKQPRAALCQIRSSKFTISDCEPCAPINHSCADAGGFRRCGQGRRACLWRARVVIHNRCDHPWMAGVLVAGRHDGVFLSRAGARLGGLAAGDSHGPALS